MNLRFLLLGLGVVQSLQALDFYGNQSGKQWSTANTPHFLVHYENQANLAAAEVAAQAEEAFDSLAPRYGVNWSVPVDLVVQDALYSNGEASVNADRVRIWTTDWGLPLRSYHPWFGDVAHHEFGHIASISLGAKGFGPFLGLHFGFNSYSNSAVRTEFGFFYPSISQTAWFAEGTAQYESARLGYDRWDAHREMIIRVAAKHDKLLNLAQMQTFLGPRDVDFELGPYTQGFALVRYISQRWGDAKVVELWKTLGQWSTYDFDRACVKALGISEKELYQQWQASLKQNYASVDSMIQPGFKRSADAYNYASLRSTAGQLWGLSNGPGNEGKLMPFVSQKNIKADSIGLWSDSSTAFVENYPQSRIAWDKGFAVIGRDSIHAPRLIAVSYKQRDKNGLAHYDLVRLDSGSKEPVALTHLGDAFEPSLSPNGRLLVWSHKSPNSPCMGLQGADLDEQGMIQGDIRTLVAVPDSEHCLNFQVRQAQISPDGKWIALTVADGSRRRLARIPVGGGIPQIIFGGGHDNRDPSWTPQGDLLWSSDRSGRFEIQMWRLADSSIVQVGHVEGGAFSPVWWRDSIAYVAYDQDGFSLYQRALDHVQNLAPDSNQVPAIPARDPIVLNGMNYHPIPKRWTVLPALLVNEKATSMISGRSGDAFGEIGALAQFFDPLEKNQIDLTALIETKPTFHYLDMSAGGLAPDLQRDAGLSWTNKSTPITSIATVAYRRLTSSDTVSHKDENPPGPNTLQDYALAVWNAQEHLEYSLFKEKDLFHLDLSWMNGSFDFYQNTFAFDFLHSYALTLGFDWGSTEVGSMDFLPIPGLEAGINWSYQYSDLFRQGSFEQSFNVNSDGTITPNFRDFQMQNVDLRLAYHYPLGGENCRLSLTSELTALPWWSSSNSDTLDAFFLPTSRMHGYPAIMPTGENSLLQGRVLGLWTIHYQFPLWKSQGSWGPLIHRGAWLDLFAEDLWEWKSLPLGSGVMPSENLNSLGAEWRLSQRIFNTVPLEVYARLSRALNTAHSSEGSWQPQPFVSWLPSWGPTSLEWGMTFRFAQPGEVRQGPQYKGIPLTLDPMIPRPQGGE